MPASSQRQKSNRHSTSRHRPHTGRRSARRGGELGSEPEVIDNEPRENLNAEGAPSQPNGTEGKEEISNGNDEQHDDESDDERDGGSDYVPPPGPPVRDIPVTPGQILRIVLDTSGSEHPGEASEHPQDRMNKFWANFEPEYEGGIIQILPDPVVPVVHKNSPNNSSGKESPTSTVRSYHQAREQCIKSVNRIVRECKALNQKYIDPHFDLERDLKLTKSRDCLDSLAMDEDEKYYPEDVKRVTDIFENPEFYKNGAGFDDIVQGRLGDCWLLSALSSLTTNEDLVEKVCVIQNQEVGVYGFVFCRDGEWQPCIIDDKLYLRAPSYDESGETVLNMYGVKHKDPEKEYQKAFQTGSKALFFAACRDENETWVPLLEKALAKAHGDYFALDGGITGEALEDLTGGVTTEIYTHNILSKERFWKERLSRMGKDFIFSCATAIWVDTRNVRSQAEAAERDGRRKGIESMHTYAILDTYEGFGKRLVKVRNPWGHREWEGAWSDGSKEWNAEWVQRLNHKFGDDGVFWISYEDLLQKYRYMDCTRLFGAEWHIAQQWARVQVPWNTRDYQQTRFSFDVPEKSEVVIVLSQLDTRYFEGLQGKYDYDLQFRVHKDGEDEEDYVVRSKVNYELSRSTNVELELDPGKYTVLFKVEAEERNRPDIETVIRQNIGRKEKITQMARLYDLALAKGQPPKKKSAKRDGVEEKGKSNESSVKDKEGQKDDGSVTSAKKPAELKDETATGNAVEETAQAAQGDDVKDCPEPSEPKPQEQDLSKHRSQEQNNPEQVQGENAQTTGNERKWTRPDPNDPHRNPWNAFCVVGLRVYSKLQDLNLKVIWHGDEETANALDRDDIAKAATEEAEAAAEQGNRDGEESAETSSGSSDDSD